MKNASIKILLLLFVLGLLMSACAKDELQLTGTLNVNFVEPPEDLRVIILPAENTNIAIYNNLEPNLQGDLSIELNMGNYVVTGFATSRNFTQVAFQIQPGKTRVIHYSSNGIGRIVE
ncbi:MAG: hypothetical protein JJU28_16990 [Cyclobacteriaceae bacterium]|nr:hypothetical protein [Cyclobacteriaceae bacterium]